MQRKNSPAVANASVACHSVFFLSTAATIFFGLNQENYQTSVPLVGNKLFKQTLLSLKPTVEVVLRFTRFHFLNKWRYWEN